jgi:hypothetical protein
MQIAFPGKIGLIAAPDMGKMRTCKDQFARLECFDTVANKSCPMALQNYKKLIFIVGVPHRVKMFFLKTPDDKDLAWRDHRLMERCFQFSLIYR